MRARQGLIATAVLAVIIGYFGWSHFVSPERSKIAEAETTVVSAHQQLEKAQSALSQNRLAQEKYAAAYAAITKLGKAVPAKYEVPALIYEIEHATNLHHIQITSIGPGGNSSSSSKGSGGQPTTFAAMPLSLVFHGSFGNLYRLLTYIQGLDNYSTTGGVSVSGRLLTIQSVNLAPGTAAGSGGGSGAGGAAGAAGELTGTITATAYVLPPGQALAGGGSSAGPAGSAGTGSSSAASSGSGSGSATTPATVRALP